MSNRAKFPKNENEVDNCLNKNSVISNKQFGFKKNLSTEDAMLSVTSFLHIALNCGKKHIAIFLDLSNAFGTIPHLGHLLDLNSSYEKRYSRNAIKRSTQLVKIQ